MKHIFFALSSLIFVFGMTGCERHTTTASTTLEPAAQTTTTVAPATETTTTPTAAAPTTSTSSNPTTTTSSTTTTNTSKATPHGSKVIVVPQTSNKKSSEITPAQLHHAVAAPVRRGTAAVILYQKNNP